MIKYTHGFTGVDQKGNPYADWDVQELPINRFINIMNEELYTCEYLTKDARVKPIFDFDCKIPSDKLGDVDIDEIVNKAENILASEFKLLTEDAIEKGHEGRAFSVAEDLVICDASRYLDDGKTYKISKRYFVRGMSIRFGDIKRIIKDRKWNDEFKSFGVKAEFDTSIYSKANLVNCIGCKKTQLEQRRFQLCTSDIHTMKDCVAQYLVGDELVFPNLPDLEIKETKTYTTVITNDLLMQIIDGLSPSRADDYDSWLHGLCVIKNTCEEKNWDPLPYAIKFSKKSDKFEGDIAVKDKLGKLDQQVGNKRTLGTLMWWLEQDNPALYKQLTSKNMTKQLENSISGSDFDMAEAFYTMFFDQFKFASNTWYMFKDHRWREIGKTGAELKKLISTDLYKAFLRESKMSKEFAKVAASCKKESKKKAILEGLVQFYKDDNFSQLLDEKPNLLGFENGVYDLDAFVFRDGKPYDNLTFSCGYDYTPIVNMQIRDFLVNLLTSIMPTTQMYDFLLNGIAYSIHGDKMLQIYYIWTGLGGNGKGIVKTLIELALGNYFYEPDPAMFYLKKTSVNAASSELVKMKGKRIVTPPEAPSDVKLQIDVIKRMTGGDNIQGRALYKDAIEFKLQAILIFLLNNLPQLSDYDQGIVRRTKVIDFPMLFRDNPLPNTNQRQIDKTLGARIKNDVRIKQQFMLILIERLQNFKQNNFDLQEPEEVINVTNDYINENNIGSKFLTDVVEITNNNKDYIEATRLHNAFMNWSGFDGNRHISNLNKIMKANGFDTKIISSGPKKGKKAYFNMKLVSQSSSYDGIDD